MQVFLLNHKEKGHMSKKAVSPVMKNTALIHTYFPAGAQIELNSLFVRF